MTRFISDLSFQNQAIPTPDWETRRLPLILGQMLEHSQLQIDGFALDFNTDWSAIDITATVKSARTVSTEQLLFVRSPRPAATAQFLELVERDGINPPLAVGGLIAGGNVFGSDEEYLLRAVAKARCGLVITPSKIDQQGIAGAEIDWIVHATGSALEWALTRGAPGPIFLDALAWPASVDPAGTRRSLKLIKAFNNEFPDTNTFLDSKIVGYGSAAELHSALLKIYIASAVGRGIDCIITPLDSVSIRRLISIATHTNEPLYADEFFLQKLIELDSWEAISSILSDEVSPILQEAAYQLFLSDPLLMSL
jgi:hypothetical protein